MIIFVSGGARSGKSSFAERKAISLYMNEKKVNSETRLIYIATAQRSDKEMEKRIAIHQQERVGEWQVYEESYNIIPILKRAQKGDVILLDCLTIWLSNLMIDIQYPFGKLMDIVSHWITIAKGKEITLLIVSNDLNEEVPSCNDFVNQYIFHIEKLHQYIVQRADCAIQVVAGIPVYWKGEGLKR